MTNGTIELPPVTVSPDVPPFTQGDNLPPGAAAAQRADRVAQGNSNASIISKFGRIEQPPFLTRAVLLINGEKYYEWDTVSVRLSLRDKPSRTFKFTCSEQTPWAADWAYLRIRPGDSCIIYLDGYPVINGTVTVRQVYYSATQHSVQIQGEDYTGVMTKGAGVSDTGEFKNQNLKQFADAISKKYGINVKAGPGVSQLKFPRISIQPGDSAWDAIEKEARAVGAWLASDKDGNLLLINADGDELTPSDAELIEGENIIEGREVIYSKAGSTGKATDQQRPGDDQTNMAQSAHQQNYENQGGAGGSLGMGFMPSRVLNEVPAWGVDFLKQRARIEENVENWMHIKVTITHLGWQRPSGGLWDILNRVWVDSPMLIMQRQLMLEAVTFQQDDRGGTRATLELVNDVSKGKAQS